MGNRGVSASEKMARAFLAHARHEKGRATACLDRIFDIILDGDDALTPREEAIIKELIAYTRRDYRVDLVYGGDDG